MLKPIQIFAAILLAAAALPGACLAAGETPAEMAAIRARAVENCNANRGVDCVTEAGLYEWIETERKRPSGQHATLLQRQLNAERQAQQRAAEAAGRKAK